MLLEVFDGSSGLHGINSVSHYMYVYLYCLGRRVYPSEVESNLSTWVVRELEVIPQD